MHFMNNKREVTTFKFDVAAKEFMNNLDSYSIHQLATVIVNNEAVTNKDSYINKVIKKYTIYDNVVDGVLNFRFFNENNQEILIDDFSEILKFDNFYSFSYFGNAYTNPFKFNLNNDDNYTYEYALYTLNKKYIKQDNNYVNKTQKSITINIDKGYTFVLNIKEKTPSTYNFYNNIVSYYSRDYDKRQYLKYATSEIYDLINSSLSVASNPIKDEDLIDSLTENDTLYYNTNYIISNLTHNITLTPTSLPNNFIYNIYHLTSDETTTTIKEEYIVKPNDIFIFNLKEQIKQHTSGELENLSFETWAKIPNITNSIENNINLIPFFSLNDMTFEELQSTNVAYSLLHDWKYISANSYEEQQKEAKKIMNEYQKYYKYIVDIRLVFAYGTKSVSYFYYDKNGELLIEENSTELTGKYILLYPYYSSVDESISNGINLKHDSESVTLKNDSESVNLKFVTPLEYNKVESLSGNVLISKIRIQTNDNQYIVMNKPSWVVKKIFIWNNNDNIVRNNNNVIIKGTGGSSIENAQTELEKAQSDLKNAQSDLAKEKNELKKTEIQTLISNLTNTIKILTIKLEQIILHKNDIVNNDMSSDSKSYISGYNEEIYKVLTNGSNYTSYDVKQYEVLDNEKQYLEIKLEKPVVYNNIQHIFIESGLNINDFFGSLVNENINTTSLLFYDSNNNQIENYTIDFSKVEFKDSVNNVENVDNIYLLKGPAYDSYSENIDDPEYANKPTTFATNYITSDKIAKFEQANNINMKLVN